MDYFEYPPRMARGAYVILLSTIVLFSEWWAGKKSQRNYSSVSVAVSPGAPVGNTRVMSIMLLPP